MIYIYLSTYENDRCLSENQVHKLLRELISVFNCSEVQIVCLGRQFYAVQTHLDYLNIILVISVACLLHVTCHKLNVVVCFIFIN